ncbi:O-unit flippase-like protein [Salinicoccus kekensis]|uniref:Na+-driven multidrug efflux pump n=1 Tax=Salinicoccus kekensis TaxID=714307 RepID=A0A285UVI0_9STAP|nr:O-unit flippase-like protein [Salinicoccus kekensis]SOC44726.1 Na+-driven multidrug efflux pump [Salinicoccus kekensis]
MNIGRKDVIWGYVSHILVQGINAILLPFVLFFLTPNELGLWYTFTALYGLAMLIDFGFQSTVSRHVSYVWSGADTVKSLGYDVVKEENSFNESFFIKLLSNIKFIYYIMGIIILIVLSTIGTFYIVKVSIDELDILIVLISWTLYMTAIILNIAFSFWNSFLKGIGAIKYYNQTLIIAKFTQLLLSILFLFLGYGILGVSIAYFISVIVNRIILSKFFYKFHKRTSILKGKIKPKFQKNIIRSLLPNTFKAGVVSVSNYLILNFPILLSSYFLSLEFSGKFGLVSQIITLILTISNSYYNTYLSKFNYYRVKGQNKEILNLFKKSVAINYFINILAFISFLIFGDMILGVIASNQELLPLHILIIIIMYRFLYNNQNIFVTLLSTKNTLPYYKSFLISALVTVLIQIVLLNINPSIYSIIFPILFVQLIFNNWYWPRVVIKDLKGV